MGSSSSADGVGDRGCHSVCGLARVKPGVLDHDRHVRLNHVGIAETRRDRLRIGEVAQPLVERAPRPHGECVLDRLAVLKEHGQAHVCRGRTAVQNARGLVRGELGRGALTPFREISVGDYPLTCTDREHDVSLPTRTSSYAKTASHTAMAARSRALPKTRPRRVAAGARPASRRTASAGAFVAERVGTARSSRAPYPGGDPASGR